MSGGRKQKRRTKEKRNNIMKSALDKVISDFREEKSEYDIAVVSIPKLASRTPVHERTFRGWSPEFYLPKKYESVSYEKYEGLLVEWQEYIEERKKERKRKSGSK